MATLGVVATYDRHGVRQRLPWWRKALRGLQLLCVFGFTLHNWVTNQISYEYANFFWDCAIILVCAEYLLHGASLWIVWLDRRWFSNHRYVWGIHQDVNSDAIDAAVIRRVNRARRAARHAQVRELRAKLREERVALLSST